MKVKELIVLLQELENQEWEIDYLDGEYGKSKIDTINVENGFYLIYEKMW